MYGLKPVPFKAGSKGPDDRGYFHLPSIRRSRPLSGDRILFVRSLSGPVAAFGGMMLFSAAGPCGGISF